MRDDHEDTVLLFSLIEDMLEYDPERRISLSKTLDHPYFEKLKPDEQLHRLHKLKSHARDTKSSRNKKLIAHSASR